jgi:hypothetical protein
VRLRQIPLAAALAGVGALGTACALALGVQDDPSQAAAVLCACDPFFSGLSTCQGDLEARLEAAPATVRAQWLQDFGTKCMSSCPAMPTCFYEPPACVAQGQPCMHALECCSYSPGNDQGACLSNERCK